MSESANENPSPSDGNALKRVVFRYYSGYENKWEHYAMNKWSRPTTKVVFLISIPERSFRFYCFILTSEAHLEATRVTCALKRYQLATATLSENLSELVPTYLSEVPSDPFNGKPLRYRRDGDNWVLWSVGPDKKDDNAAKRVRYFDETGDIVFGSKTLAHDYDFYYPKEKSG